MDKKEKREEINMALIFLELKGYRWNTDHTVIEKGGVRFSYELMYESPNIVLNEVLKIENQVNGNKR